jgi:hypothetical protein
LNLTIVRAGGEVVEEENLPCHRQEHYQSEAAEVKKEALSLKGHHQDCLVGGRTEVSSSFLLDVEAAAIKEKNPSSYSF